MLVVTVHFIWSSVREWGRKLANVNKNVMFPYVFGGHRVYAKLSKETEGLCQSHENCQLITPTTVNFPSLSNGKGWGKHLLIFSHPKMSVSKSSIAPFGGDSKRTIENNRWKHCERADKLHGHAYEQGGKTCQSCLKNTALCVYSVTSHTMKQLPPFNWCVSNYWKKKEDVSTSVRCCDIVTAMHKINSWNTKTD